MVASAQRRGDRGLAQHSRSSSSRARVDLVVVGLSADAKSPRQPDVSRRCSSRCSQSRHSPSPSPHPRPRTLASFDDDWKFHRGDASGASDPKFDDGAWRTLDVPHDWSSEDLPPRAADVLTVRNGTWKFHRGDDAHWSSPAFDDSAWERVRVPSDWRVASNYTAKDAVGWYRRSFDATDAQVAAASLKLALGAVAKQDTTYLNGQQIGASGSEKANCGDYLHFRSYDVPAGLLKPSANVLAVRVFSEGGGVADGFPGGLYDHPTIANGDRRVGRVRRRALRRRAVDGVHGGRRRMVPQALCDAVHPRRRRPRHVNLRRGLHELDALAQRSPGRHAAVRLLDVPHRRHRPPPHEWRCDERARGARRQRRPQLAVVLGLGHLPPRPPPHDGAITHRAVGRRDLDADRPRRRRHRRRRRRRGQRGGRRRPRRRRPRPPHPPLRRRRPRGRRTRPARPRRRRHRQLLGDAHAGAAGAVGPREPAPPPRARHRRDGAAAGGGRRAAARRRRRWWTRSASGLGCGRSAGVRRTGSSSTTGRSNCAAGASTTTTARWARRRWRAPRRGGSSC